MQLTGPFPVLEQFYVPSLTMSLVRSCHLCPKAPYFRETIHVITGKANDGEAFEFLDVRKRQHCCTCTDLQSCPQVSQYMSDP